jgi:hypothetical protein
MYETRLADTRLSRNEKDGRLTCSGRSEGCADAVKFSQAAHECWA